MDDKCHQMIRMIRIKLKRHEQARKEVSKQEIRKYRVQHEINIISITNKADMNTRIIIIIIQDVV